MSRVRSTAEAEVEAAAKLLDSLGWSVTPPIERLMSDEDRTKLVEILQEQYVDLSQDDVKSTAEDAMDWHLSGVEGLEELTDDVLLDQASDAYGEEALNSGEELVSDPALRIWAKYRKPDLLCPWCGGTGDATHESDPAIKVEPILVDNLLVGLADPGDLPNCSLCDGTGAGPMFKDALKEPQAKGGK